MYFLIVSVVITTFSSTRHMLPQPDWLGWFWRMFFVSRGSRCGELTYVSYCKLLVKFVKMHVSLLKLNSSYVFAE